jgi:hypothetical protein
LLRSKKKHPLANCHDSGVVAGGFGASLGLFALFFFGEVPRVRKDIFQKLPFFDRYFDRTIPPEDRVRFSPLKVKTMLTVISHSK